VRHRAGDADVLHHQIFAVRTNLISALGRHSRHVGTPVRTAPAFRDGGTWPRPAMRAGKCTHATTSGATRREIVPHDSELIAPLLASIWVRRTPRLAARRRIVDVRVAIADSVDEPLSPAATIP